MSLLKLVRRIDGREGAFRCVNGNCPLSLTVAFVIERERGLDYAVGTIRNICGFGITTVIGRSNSGYFSARGVINGKDGTAKSTVVLRSLLINLNVTFLQLVNCIDSDYIVLWPS